MRGCNAAVAAPHVSKISLPCVTCLDRQARADIGANLAPGFGSTYATKFFWHAPTECFVGESQRDVVMLRERCRLFRERRESQCHSNRRWRGAGANPDLFRVREMSRRVIGHERS